MSSHSLTPGKAIMRNCCPLMAIKYFQKEQFQFRQKVIPQNSERLSCWYWKNRNFKSGYQAGSLLSDRLCFFTSLRFEKLSVINDRAITTIPIMEIQSGCSSFSNIQLKTAPETGIKNFHTF